MEEEREPEREDRDRQLVERETKRHRQRDTEGDRKKAREIERSDIYIEREKSEKWWEFGRVRKKTLLRQSQ